LRIDDLEPPRRRGEFLGAGRPEERDEGRTGGGDEMAGAAVIGDRRGEALRHR
jgi:hypothetical protein